MTTWTKHEARIEEAEFGACYEAAAEDGHTVEEAEQCEEGSLLCAKCPWKDGSICKLELGCPLTQQPYKKV